MLDMKEVYRVYIYNVSWNINWNLSENEMGTMNTKNMKIIV